MEQNNILESDRLLEKTIAQCFEYRVSLTPDAPAVEFEGERISWNELDRLSDGLVWRFDFLGIKRGTRAGIWCGNNLQWIIVFLGLQKIGATAVLINPGYLADELHKIISYSDVEYLFYGEEFKNADLTKILAEVDISTTPNLKQTIPIELKAAIDFMKKGAEELTEEQKQRIYELKQLPDCKDTACMLFTSGTTALPKGVLLTHYNLVNDAMFTAKAMHWEKDDKICVMVPLFHCFGMTSCLLASVICGSCLYVMKYYRTINALEGIDNHGCTVLNGVPSMFLAMVHNRHFEEFKLNSLKSGIIAGSPLSASDYKMICEKLGMEKLQMSYGQTETSPGISFSEYDETIEQKCDNAGFIIPFIEVCVWDLEGNQNIYHCDVLKPDGRILGREETGESHIHYTSLIGDKRNAVCTRGTFFSRGEIGVRGFNVMKGYFRREEATREVLTEDGFIHTGDLGFVDDSGRIHISGRIKEMIIRGGENISPVEIEECIRMFPQVRDVKVVGVPQAVLQEEIAACIVLRKNCELTKEEITAHCSKYLAAYKVPRYIEFFEELPVNSSNKIKIGELKERMRVLALANK